MINPLLTLNGDILQGKIVGLSPELIWLSTPSTYQPWPESSEGVELEEDKSPIILETNSLVTGNSLLQVEQEEANSSYDQEFKSFEPEGRKLRTEALKLSVPISLIKANTQILSRQDFPQERTTKPQIVVNAPSQVENLASVDKIATTILPNEPQEVEKKQNSVWLVEDNSSTNALTRNNGTNTSLTKTPNPDLGLLKIIDEGDIAKVMPDETKIRVSEDEALISLTSLPSLTWSGVFDIYVEDSLLSDIQESLNTYVTDLTREGYLVTVQPFLGSAEQLRSQLQSRWLNNNLEGALFIGDLPHLDFTSEDNFSTYPHHVTYPHDLYFMDLDGVYELRPSGLDLHTSGNGDVGPEIYISRLTTHNLAEVTGKSEVTLINDYFAKTHAYRTGQLLFENRGMVFADDDWRYWGTEQMQDLYSTVLAINDPAETNKTTYLNSLTLDYESILECIHSSTGGHSLDGEWIDVREIAATNPRIGFYNMFNCSSANFTVNDNLIGTYVYSGDYGLNAIGSTKTGSMLNFSDYYRPLGNGDSLGQAFLQWFDLWAAETDDPNADWQLDWFYGMTMQGDPTLRPALMGNPPGEIHGTLWNDKNNNGIRDPGEPGLKNWFVYLDDNQNGQLDPGETTTQTNIYGDYAFTGLKPDTYTIAEVGCPDWEQNYPMSFGGYTWSDSDQVNGPTFNWRDISSIGTPIDLWDDDYTQVTLPFTFPFYGEDKNTVKISSNGYLSFGSDAWEYYNQPISAPDQPNDFIAPFWDDLNPSVEGSIYYYHDAAEDQFIVQYQEIPHYYDEGSYTFEVILHSDGSIVYQYDELNGILDSATIGVENANGTEGVQIAYNQNYVHDQLAVSIAPLSENPKPHTVTVESGQVVTDIGFSNHQTTAPTIIYGTKGNDNLTLIDNPVTVYTMSGDDFMDGTRSIGGNTFSGGTGGDTILGNYYDLLCGGPGDDLLDVTNGHGLNSLYGDDGNDLLKAGKNDCLNGGAGNDRLIAGQFGTKLIGGLDSDQFWIVSNGDLPITAHTIEDFSDEVDQIAIEGLGISFSELDLTQIGNDTALAALNTELAIVKGISPNALTSSDFILIA